MGGSVDNPVSWKPSRAFLQYAIAANLIGAAVFIVVARIVTPDQPVRLIGPMLIVMLALSAWFFLSRGRPHHAVNVLAVGVLLVATIASAFHGGVRAPVVIVFPLMVCLFGWMIGRPAALAASAFSIVATVGFVAADTAGWLPTAPPSPAALHGVVQISLIVLATLIITVLVDIYRSRLAELKQQSTDLARHVHDLETSQATLRRAQTVANIGSWVYDIAADKMQLSAETCRIFALPEGTTGSREAYLARAHIEDRSTVDAAWQAALKGAAFDHEHRIMVSKAVRWIRQKAEFQFGSDGTAIAAMGITQDITERKQRQAAMLALHGDLNASRQRLRDLVTQNEARLEAERKHIAREVHDELGQVLTALRIDLSLLSMRFGELDPVLRDNVSDMKKLTDRAIQGVRSVAINLRPSALDMGLVAAVEWLCDETTRKTGVPFRLETPAEGIDLDEARAVVVFRIAQESLTNITRYAHASQVSVILTRHDDQLRMEVRDNGQGFDLVEVSQKKTFGLLGMNERALAMGGSMNITSAPGQGSVVAMVIPFNLAASIKAGS